VLYRDVAAILFVGAVCGIYFGLKCDWQIAVESAQVVAGVVEYPPDNPFYMYHVKSWTLLHQLPAALLKCGVSEGALSMGIACLAAGVFLQSLGLICYAFCRDCLLSCAVPLVYLATNVVKGCGAVYPIFIVPSEYWTSYGVTGTACALFAWSLWGLGMRRPAAFISGVAPAIHPALGGWCLATTAVALVWTWRAERVQPIGFSQQFRRWLGQNLAVLDRSFAKDVAARRCPGRAHRGSAWPLRMLAKFRVRFGQALPQPPLTKAQDARHPRVGPALLWFAIGAGLTAVSFLVQQYLARGLPTADPVLSQKLLTAFVEGWDNHRVPFPLGSVDCQYGWCLLTLTAAVHAWFAKKLPRNSRLLLRILLISALGSLILCVLTHFAHWLPTAVMMAMPGRFINLAVLTYPAVLLGLLARGRRVWTINCLLCGLSLFCLLRTLMLSKQLIYVPAAHKVFIASGFILISLLASRPGGGTAWVRQFVRYAAWGCLLLAGFLWRSDLHLAVLLWSAAPLLWLLSNRLDGLYWGRLLQLLGAGTVACLWLAFMVKTGYLLGLGSLLAVVWLRSASVPLVASVRTALVGGQCPVYKPPIVSLVLATCCLVLVSTALVKQCQAGYQLFADAECDPVITAARRERGMLLAVPRMCLVQLRTRRPVLLNGEAMNQITYVPQSGPAMNRIVQHVYGDDILTPRPPWWQNWGGLMEHSGYDLWQSRNAAEWDRLGREFGFSNIITSREWKLKLPVVARSEKLILYHVSD
jgi:hypothetical protein